MHFKKRFSDYTKRNSHCSLLRFLALKVVKVIRTLCSKFFIAVTEHPEGSDLIYYNDDDLTPDKVVAAVRE